MLCRVLEYSRGGYYAWSCRPESKHSKGDRLLEVQVRAAHEAGRKYYGSPRIMRALRAQGVRVGRNRVMRLMREQGIQARSHHRFKNTTDSSHALPVAPNLLNRNFTAQRPNQRWAADTTELLTPDGKLYLAAILDLFSRFVVGWAISTSNDTLVVLKALDMALRRRCPGPGMLHHSDRGSTYASGDHRKALEAHRITCSMSGSGNCLDNAAMESWNSTLKSELGEHFESQEDAQAKVFDYIEVFYNLKRLHSALDYLSPADFERDRARQAA